MLIKWQKKNIHSENIHCSAAAKYKIYSRLSCSAPISRSGKCSFQIKQEPRWGTILETSGQKYLKNSILLCVDSFKLNTCSNSINNLWPIIGCVISQWIIFPNVWSNTIYCHGKHSWSTEVSSETGAGVFWCFCLSTSLVGCYFMPNLT